MKNSQTTLKDWLKTELNITFLYQNKRKKGYTLDVGSGLSDDQLKKFQEKVQGNEKVLSINNKVPYTSMWDHFQTLRYKCVVKTTELPSKILV